MTDIHIITSAKGGVGKTMCSLSCLWAYHQRSIRILALDANVHNPDFAKLTSMGVNPRPVNGGQTLHWAPFPWLAVERLGELYKLPHGAVEIWDSIHDSCQRNTSFPCVIVDTGLHPLNLLRMGDDETKQSIEGLVSLRQDGNLRVYLWFIWTIASVLDRDPSFGLGDTLKAIDDVINNWNSRWASMAQMDNEFMEVVHVVNPYSLYRPIELGDLVQGLRGKARVIQINDLVRINLELQATPVNLNFSDFGKCIHQVVDAKALPQNRFFPMFKAFRDGKIGNESERIASGRPRNVFPIPYHFESAADFPLNLLQKTPRNVGDLVEGYREFGEALSLYLREYLGY